MGRYRLGILALLVVAALVGGMTRPAIAGVEGTWTDGFADASRIQSSSGVRLVNGTVRLGPAPMTRRGLAFDLAQGVGSPAILLHGATYYLYYATGVVGSYSIGAATSTDGANWTDHGTVIAPGFQGTVDAMDVLYETALAVGSAYHMWYSGQNSSTGLYSVLHATSADGLNWTAAGTALAPEVIGGIPESAYAPAVYWNGSGYVMWYTTYDGSQTWIRLATSLDGLSWTRLGVVLAPQGPDDTSGPRMPTVVRTATDFVMWYTCVSTTGSLCRARSPDGRTWVREGAVLAPDPNVPGESGGLALPTALALGAGRYRVWYGGGGVGPSEIYSAIATDGYASPGFLTSVPVLLPSNETWLWVQVSKSESAGTSIRVAILDSATGAPIPGYTGLTGDNVSLTGIDWRTHPSIELNATLTSTASGSPVLDAWSVAYGTPPPPPATVWGFVLNPLVLVLAVLAAAGVAVYIVFRKARQAKPPQAPPAR